MIRIYGTFDGQHSLARVGRGFLRAFEDGVPVDVRKWGNDLDDSAAAAPYTEDAIFVGDLSELHMALRMSHRRLWVMVTPNSDTFGSKFLPIVSEVTHMITPSRWAAGVLRAHFPDREVEVTPHGVESTFRRRAVVRDSSQYRVLHLSSSTRQRKGTRELIEGWSMALKEGLGKADRLAQLFISAPDPQHVLELGMLTRDLGCDDSVRISSRVDFDEGSMAQLYSTMDLVAQPSRGEGFGLVPLEARCCGTPVLMTECSGHRQHYSPQGTVKVATHKLAPIDDFPGAMAPELRPEDVAESLLRAYACKEELSAEAQACAGALRKQWSWENQLKEFKHEVSR